MSALKLHRIVAAVCALQMLLWLGSGLALSLISEDYLDSGAFRTERTAPNSDAAKPIPPGALPGDVLEIKMDYLLERPVYRLKLASGNSSLWADTLSPLELSDDALKQIAAASISAPLTDTIDYVAGDNIGFPDIARVALFKAQTARDTRVLLDADSGAVLAHKDQGSDLKELLLMLHFMDYAPGNGIGFNAWPIRLFALLTLMMVLSGLVSLYQKWQAGYFRLSSGKSATTDLIVEDCQGRELGRFAPRASLLDAINADGDKLPTHCGGGGSCGMCALMFIDNPPTPTAADIDKLGQRVEAGMRLACQHGHCGGRVRLISKGQERFWQKHAPSEPAFDKNV